MSNISILGAGFIGQMHALAIHSEREGFVLTGFIGLPTMNRRTSSHQFLFIDGRPVRDKLLYGSVRGAYSDFVAYDRHPIIALFLETPAGAVDVVVTDGFTGNIALKTAEGTAKLINGFVREAFRNSLWAKLGYVFAKHSLDKLRNRSDPRRYNGAMFLGLNGICVKSHGGTDALGFATAIGVAIDMINYGGNQMIAEHIAQLNIGEQSE